MSGTPQHRDGRLPSRRREPHEGAVRRQAATRLPTTHGDFMCFAFREVGTGLEHVALVHGDPPTDRALTRVHSECLTGDVFGSTRCDCGDQLDLAMRLIVAEGAGVIVYLRGHEGRGIGLTNKLRAYTLQSLGADTVEANLALGLPVDSRSYFAAAAILRSLGIQGVRLLTNNPKKIAGLEGAGITVDERVPIRITATAETLPYLRTKSERLGHDLDLATR